MDIARLYDIYRQFPVVSTDTRKITPGSIFFALKGANFDGNLFAAQALASGAAYAVVDDATVAVDDRFVLVPDVLLALQSLFPQHGNDAFVQLNVQKGKWRKITFTQK